MFLFKKCVKSPWVIHNIRCWEIWKRNFSHGSSNVYHQFDTFLKIEEKSPDEIIELLKIVNKEKRCNSELMRSICNHIYDFSDDYFPPQIVNIFNCLSQLPYSNETLLASASNRIHDVVQSGSCLRIKTMINVCKKLNFHHPLVKGPLLIHLNKNIFQYRNELVSIIKNLSYIYPDEETIDIIMNHIHLNYDYYQKDFFTIFESSTRLGEPKEFLLTLLSTNINQLKEKNLCLPFKDYIKFLSGCRRVGLREDSYLHEQFEKKVKKIQRISPNNISYFLLMMLSTKMREVSLMELIMMNIENYVNNADKQLKGDVSNYYFPLGNALNSESKKTSTYNEYMVTYLPFHLLLLLLLDYDNKNTLLYLLQLCVNEYIMLYDTSSLIKLIYAYTLCYMNYDISSHEQKVGKKEYKEKIEKIEDNLIKLLCSIKNEYKSVNAKDFRILYDCVLFFTSQHSNTNSCFINNKLNLSKYQEVNIFCKEVLLNECFSILPSCYSNLSFDELEVIRCGSSSYLKDKEFTYVYLNKNDFYSTQSYEYSTLLMNIRFKLELLKRTNPSNQLKIIYEGNNLK